MGQLSMKVDVVPFTHFIVATGIALGVVLIAFIVGITGPEAKTSTITFAYGCENNSHTWNYRYCNGSQPGFGNRSYTLQTWALSPMNRFWGVRLLPFNGGWKLGTENTETTLQLEIESNVSHRNSPKEGWTDEVTNEFKRVEVVCPMVSTIGISQGACESFTMLYEQTIGERYHSASFVFSVKDPSPTSHLGDVGFELIVGTAKFSNLELGINIVFLVSTLAVFLVFIWALHSHNFSDWTFEQLFTFILLLGLLLYNNPFFALKYLTSGWFFTAFDSFVKTLFLSALLLFWSLEISRLRRNADPSWSVKEMRHIPKYILVGAFFIFSIVAFTWAALSDRADPVLSTPLDIPGVAVFYALSVSCVIAVIVYTCVLAVLGIPAVTSSQMLFTRFAFFSIPTVVVAISLVVGTFSGGIGAIGRTSLELCYFTVMYNLYVWILVYGFWPSKSPYRGTARATIVEPDDDEEEAPEVQTHKESAAVTAAPAAEAAATEAEEQQPMLQQP